ncbi:MAG: hypothetical protein AAGG02_19235 [Cyanobacteria bacterium P01_H01_bin.15]
MATTITSSWGNYFAKSVIALVSLNLGSGLTGRVLRSRVWLISVEERLYFPKLPIFDGNAFAYMG